MNIYDNSLEEHSIEVREIIGESPKWIISWGNSILFLVVVMGLCGAAVIKYPDIVYAPISIRSSDPPTKLFSQSNGKLAELLSKDGDMVHKDDIIAVIENTARTQDILKVKSFVRLIDTTTNLKGIVRDSINILTSLQLGPIQSEYATLLVALNNYLFFIQNGYYTKNLSAINAQISNNLQINNTIVERQSLVSEEMAKLAWKDSVYKTLYDQKVISKDEYNEIRRGFVHQGLNVVDIKNSFLQNNKQGTELGKSKTEILHQYQLEELENVTAIKSIAQRIRAQIDTWEKQYVIRSPANGKLVFFNVRSLNQYIASGTAIFLVVPEIQEYEVRLQLPIYKAGKVRPGQIVNIKLTEYPFEEFGMIRARIEKVSNVYLDSFYTVQLQLLNGLKTTRNKVIELQPEITGLGEILTKDMTILERIFNSAYGKISKS